MYASMLGKIKSNYSYNLPALADAILDIIKEDTGEYKNDILNNIIVNHVNDEIIVRAKERLIQKVLKSSKSFCRCLRL